MRKVLTFLLIGSIIFSLTACGSTKEKTERNQSEISDTKDESEKETEDVSSDIVQEESKTPWYYVKKKYKLNMNFSSNICYFILPVSPSDSIHDYTSFRIHLVKDIHNDYEFLLYYKKSLYTEIPAYMHGHN